MLHVLLLPSGCVMWYHDLMSPAGRLAVCCRQCLAGGMIDTFESYVWEPSLVKANAITAATEAACLVLSVDETITNPRSEVRCCR